MSGPFSPLFGVPVAAVAIRFEDITDSLARLPDVIKSIPDIIREPSANPLQASILLAIFLVLILILLLTAALVVMGPSRKTGSATGGTGRGRAPSRKLSPGERVRGRTFTASLAVIVLALLWTVVGITSASRDVCESCHVRTTHTASQQRDPHRWTSCIACHEGGGPIARATVNPVLRLRHFVLGRASTPAAAAYGQTISSQSCHRCHESELRSVSLDKARGVKVSHQEPLDAGAECVDCHALEAGLVTSRTVGMAPCLRCHDGRKAKAACEGCHVGEPAYAIRSSEPSSGAFAQELVSNPGCDGCHGSDKTCDACHGTKMPHAQVFMAYGHAREAAVDIWENGGRACKKCHYLGRRDCSDCHGAPFPQHGLSFKYAHRGSEWTSGCTCHDWNVQERTILFCQICHATKPQGVK